MKSKSLWLLSLLVGAFFFSPQTSFALEPLCQPIVETFSPQYSALPRSAVGVPLLQVMVTTTDCPLKLRGATLQRIGLSSAEDLGRLWLEAGYYQPRSLRRRMNSDDQVTLLWRRAIHLAANQTFVFTVRANLQIQGSGRTVGLRLQNLLVK